MNKKKAIFHKKSIVSSFLLDDYPNAQLAYSLRYLKSGITNVIRVRRDSDNSEQDFTPSQITGGALASFCFGTDGFVSIWYDQSGNSKDMSTTTSSGEPQIVSGGAVNIDSGFPYVYYDGAEGAGADSLKVFTSGLNNVSGSVFMLYNSNDSSNEGCLINGGSSTTYTGLMANNTATPNFNSGTPSYYENGNLISPANRQTLLNNYVLNQDVLATILSIGFSSSSNWDARFAPFVYWSGTRSHENKAREIVVYNSDQTSNKSGIETNINNYYSIY